MKRSRFYPFSHTYVFNRVLVNNPDIAAAIVRMAAPDYIQKINLKRMRIIDEDVQHPVRNRRHVRFDVVLFDQHNIIDLEMQNRKEPDLVDRTRYYLDASDINWLKPGEPYRKLPNTIILMICQFDSSGIGLERFSVTEKAGEIVEGQPVSVQWNSRYVKIFLNTAVPHPGNTSLSRFLAYVSTGQAADPLTRRIDQEVNKINKYEWRGIMNFEQIILDERSDAMRIGVQQGKRQGLLQGKKLERDNGKRILYNTLIKNGMSARKARAAADEAYANRH